MSKQPKEISIDRTIVYKEREELNLIIPLEGIEKKKSEEEITHA